MSLRNRLLIALSLIAMLLVGGAVLVTHTTTEFLRHQVDRQFRDGRPPMIDTHPDGEGDGPPWHQRRRFFDPDETTKRLVTTEFAITAVILAALGLVGWWVLRLGVRPINAMAAAAKGIAGGQSNQRVPDAPPGTEAGDLSTALNAMLERIDSAFDAQAQSEARLRQFLADASHELRTPVTTVRGYAELYRAGALGEPDSLDNAMARTEAEAIRMGNLVNDMLSLARLENGGQPERSDVRLDQVAANVVADQRVVHPERSITVTTDPTVVEGVADQLHQVVANLVGNAILHTPGDAAIDVSVTQHADHATLVVSDRGPGMDDITVHKAFDRFYRADASRTRSSGGAGLGLSIVAAIVAAHHGTIEIDSSTEPNASGTTVRVVLPTASNTEMSTSDTAVEQLPPLED